MSVAAEASGGPESMLKSTASYRLNPVAPTDTVVLGAPEGGAVALGRTVNVTLAVPEGAERVTWRSTPLGSGGAGPVHVTLPVPSATTRSAPWPGNVTETDSPGAKPT